MHTTPSLQNLNSMYTSCIVCMYGTLSPPPLVHSSSHFFLLPDDAVVEVEATLPSFFKPTADARLPIYGM